MVLDVYMNFYLLNIMQQVWEEKITDAVLCFLKWYKYVGI